MTDFFDIAITPSVLEHQRQKGSFGLYVDEVGPGPSGPSTLSGSEAEFLTARDSFYLATVGETGWPYVQHRGGDRGFIKQLDPHTIGWVERNGNRQYVGTGNIVHNGRVAAIFVDYPNRARLKIYGQATYHADPSAELLEALDATDVRHDGAITIEILATSWNCPKFIAPRYTEDAVREVVAPLQARISELEEQLSRHGDDT